MRPRFVGRLGPADVVTAGNAALGFVAAVLTAVDVHLAAKVILLAAMADRLAVVDANLHQAIQTADGQSDLDTADLLNEVSRDVSKALWFVEAHLQRTGAQQQQGAAVRQPDTAIQQQRRGAVQQAGGAQQQLLTDSA